MKKTIFILALLCFVLTWCTTPSSSNETPNPTVVEGTIGKEREETQVIPSSTNSKLLHLPSNLPTTLATSTDINGDGGYLLIGNLPEEKIALYCDNSEERNQVYIQYEECFQVFNQKVWTDPTILPELEWIDWDEDGDIDLIVKYLKHEGTYFDGETTSTGVVYEEVVYQWDGTQWTDIHFYSGGANRIEES